MPRPPAASCVVPALGFDRPRPADVPALARHFLDRFRRELKRELAGFQPEALACLRLYGWPGNVRELENVIERAVVLTDGPDVTVRDLPAEIRDAAPEGGARS